MPDDESTKEAAPDKAAPPTTGELRPGQEFAGRYEVIDTLGKGSFGLVYRARDLSLHRTVALKVLRTEVIDTKALTEDKARFVREATTAAALTHPHIATIYDAGESGGVPYIAMELVEGRTLREILEAEGAFPFQRALNIARQTAATLTYAHAHDIIHRDIKPGNILLTTDDQIKLADFGLAKIFRGDASGSPTTAPLTKEGTIVGTLQYLSPEYIRGEAVNDRADVYAMGIVLYEMLTGKPPFDSLNMMDILKMHLESEPKPLVEAVKTSLPKDFDVLVHKMLSKSRAERPSADEASRELDRIQTLLADEASKTMIVELPKTEDLPADEVPTDPYIGRVIRDCKVLEIIGEGGMGAVYKAQHVQLGTYRAIKIIRKELAAQAGFFDRFRNEALLTEGLRHPNLVTLYDFSRLEDGSIYSMWEYVEGENLEESLKRTGRIRPLDVARIMQQVLSGLAEAHRRGIVHRDLSLDNIMLVREDDTQNVKLIDFGIAKSLKAPEPGTPFTEVGVFVGKIGYSSPEQLGDLPKDQTIDARTDIFSSGIVLFRMLTGRFPFDSSSMTTYMRDIAVSTPEKLRRRFPPYVPLPLQSIAVKCLATDPALRFQSAEELSEALRQVDYNELLRRPVQAKRRSRFAVALAVALVLLAGATFYLQQKGFLDLERLGLLPAEPEVTVRDFRRLAEEAFAAGNLLEPPTASARYWAQRLSEAERGDASYLNEMEGRIAERLIAEGEALLSSRQPEDQARARDAFVRALALWPDDEKARFGLSLSEGALALFRDDPEAALAFFNEAKDINPMSKELRLWMAEAHRALSDRYAEAGDWDAARRERDEATFLNPNYGPGDFKLAALEKEEKEAQQKLAALKKPRPKPSAPPKPPRPAKMETVQPPRPAQKVEARPGRKEEPPPPATPRASASDDPAKYNNQGNLYFKQGKYKEAEEQFRLALSIDPENPLIQNNLANLYYTQRKYAQAQPHYEKVVLKDPKNHKAHYYLGMIAMEQKQPEQAEKMFREALLISPAQALYLFELGNALEDQRQLDEAARVFQRAIDLGLDKPAVHMNLGNIYLDLDRPKEAVAEYQKAVALAPGDAYAYYNLGMAQFDLKNYAEARASWEKAVQHKPGYASAHFALGNLHWQQKRLTDAKFHYEKAVQLKPNHGHAHYNLSLVYDEMGDGGAAAKSRRRACELGVARACSPQ
jgi:serine/threonine protein kinase/Tfp pilus assembly protein PilF